MSIILLAKMSLHKLLLTLVFIVAGVKGTAKNNVVEKTNGDLCEKDHPMCSQYSYVQIYCGHEVIKRKCKKACGLCKEELSTTTATVTTIPVARTTPVVKDDPKVAAPAKNCKPDHPRCRLYDNKKYYCPQFWMRENCCNYCREDPTSSNDLPLNNLLTQYPGTQMRHRRPKICKKQDNPMCEQYMQSGREHYCSHHVIRKHCKKACGICVDQFSEAVDNVNNVDNPSPLSMMATTCPNPDIPMCTYYVNMGKEHYCKQAYMQAYCKKACNLCL